MLDWLKEILGEAYTDDIDKQVSDHIGKNFVSRADFNTKNEANKELEKQIKERDKQLDELKEVDADGLQKRISELEDENKTSKEEYEAKLSGMQKDWATEKYFEGFEFTSDLAKTAAMQQFKEKELKFEDGKFLGADDFMKEMKEKNPTAFKSEEDKNKPQITKKTGSKPKGDEKMSLEEAMKYKNEHPEANIDDLI